MSLLINQSQVLRGVLPLTLSLHVPTAIVEIADPECILSEGGPGGEIKELEQFIIKPGSASVRVRGTAVNFSKRTQAFVNTPMVNNVASGKVLDNHINDTSECDVDRLCTNQSKTLSAIAIWINQVSHYNFPCPLQSQDHDIAECPEFLALSPKDRWLKFLGGASFIRA